MKYRISIEIPGGTIELEADNQKQVFDELSFWQSLPKVCPIDGTSVRLNVRETSKGDYYELLSSGNPIFRGHVGQNREGGTLFYDDTWNYYEGGDSSTVVRSKGKNTPALDRVLAGAQPQQATGQPQQAGQPQPVAHRNGAQQPQQPDPATGVRVSLAQRIEAVFTKAKAQPATKYLITQFTNGETDQIVDLGAAQCQTLLQSLLSEPYALQLGFELYAMFAGFADVVDAARWVIGTWTKNYSQPSRGRVSELSADECKAMLATIAEKGPAMKAAYMRTLQPAEVTGK